MNTEPINPLEDPKSTRLPAWVMVLALAVLAGFLVIIGASLGLKSSPPIRQGDPIPDFTLTTFDGKTYHSTELQGKVVLINFWASWCTTCADEAASLQQAWQEFAPTGKVLFLGVDYSDTQPEALAYMKYFGMTYPSGSDLGTRISQLFRITGVPETYIFDPSGKLASVTIGPYKSTDEIRSVINGLMQE